MRSKRPPAHFEGRVRAGGRAAGRGEGPATFVMRLANLGDTHSKSLKAALGKDGWERTPLIDDCQH